MEKCKKINIRKKYTLYMCRLTRFFGHNFFSSGPIALKPSEMTFLGVFYPQ